MRTSSSRNRLPLIAACVAVIAAVSAPSQAAPAGSFDNSFSGDGRALAPMGAKSYAHDTYVMENGRILVIGVKAGGAPVVLRYLPNGSLDTSFGNEGVASVPLPDTERLRVIARGTDIYAAATASDGDDFNWVFMKLTNAGDVVDDYGNEGTLVVDAGGIDRMRDLVPGADGKFYGVGQSHDGQQQFMVARFNSDGTLDTTDDSTSGTNWSIDGLFVSDNEGNPSPLGLHELPDGYVIVVGAGNNYAANMTRFTPDGEIDETFHEDGTIEHELGPNLTHIERIGFGRDFMYIAANGAGSNPHIRVARLTYDGQLDPNFDDDGRVNVDLGGDAAYASHLAVDALGRPVIAAARYDEGEPTLDWIVLRLETDGDRDPSFGNNGVAKSSAWVGTGESPIAVAIQADGRIVVVGTVAPTPDGAKIGTARYLSGTCGTIGTSGPDILGGTPAKDYICGLGESDELIGEGGNDKLAGGGGSDVLIGGPGTDVCIGGKGADQYFGCEVEK